MFTLVDLETTGAYARDHRIIEIAIIRYDGSKIIERFETLVNPERPIPLHITALTGISDEMVADAPTFAEVAEQVDALTKDAIFVAHQVNFDYSFLRHQLEACDIQFQRKKLCTLRLSRKLIPNLPAYGLGRICDALGFPFEDRHRAMGDAEAAAQLFAELQRIDEHGEIEAALHRASRAALLPPNLEKAQFDRLPEEAGVYYFKDAKGKVIYVGKAKRLKTRVTSHFSGTASSWQKQHFMQLIHSIDFDLTGTELMALLLEDHQIKKHWPRFNRAQKTRGPRLGLVTYEDRSGYLRVGLHNVKRSEQTLHRFHTMSEGRNFLWSLVDQHALCPRLSGLQQGSGPCSDYVEGTCDGACCREVDAETYNKRVTTALAAMQAESPSLAIIGAGRNAEERSIVWMEDGRYRGMGFAPAEALQEEQPDLSEFITPYPDHPEARNIILAHLRKNPAERVIELPGSLQTSTEG